MNLAFNTFQAHLWTPSSRLFSYNSQSVAILADMQYMEKHVSFEKECMPLFEFQWKYETKHFSPFIQDLPKSLSMNLIPSVKRKTSNPSSKKKLSNKVSHKRRVHSKNNFYVLYWTFFPESYTYTCVIATHAAVFNILKKLKKNLNNLSKIYGTHEQK